VVLNAFLSGDDNTKIAESSVIYITNKTVRFGDDVYQFRNVTGFGIGKVKSKTIPFLFILILFCLGVFILKNSSDFSGQLCLYISIAALLFNILRPRLYGLKLYLNSGDAQIFVTSKTLWLENCVAKLYDFMEKAEEGSFMTIKIGGHMTGNIVQGSTTRDISTIINRVSKT
jgi:hypothetical protein